MRQSKFFINTQKETPKDEESINAILLQRASFIYKEMAGIYTYLPLGFKVLKKIERIVREEMEKISGQELLMTVFQPKKLWQETGRWEKEIGEVMYKCEGEVGLGPTHEEMITDIIRNYIKSYEDLPLYLFQIQTKFRKEPRPRSGLLRGREFYMKDLYSFHSSEKDFQKYYEKVKKAYLKIFQRCGLKAIITEASGKGFTSGFTHEFQVLTEGGEDRIFFCPLKHFSQNKDITEFAAGSRCPICKRKLEEGKTIEVGNIFPLGTKYSDKMGAYFINKDGKRKLIIMGCYGIGLSRVMGAIVEVYHDEKGIIWPEEVAPFNFHLIPIFSGKKEIDKKIKGVSEKIYQDLLNKNRQKGGFEVLYDDRETKSAGEKFADCDLIGIPIRLVVSEKTLSKNCLEIKKRKEEKVKLFPLSKLKTLSQNI